MVDSTLFHEIPESLRKEIDQELILVAMEILHAEAVAAGDIPPAPKPLFYGPFGKLLFLFFQLLAGGVIGFGAVALSLWLLKSLATVLS